MYHLLHLVPVNTSISRLVELCIVLQVQNSDVLSIKSRMLVGIKIVEEEHRLLRSLVNSCWIRDKAVHELGQNQSTSWLGKQAYSWMNCGNICRKWHSNQLEGAFLQIYCRDFQTLT